MISVIITTHNRADKLKRAIDSVLAQTYKDWELIIVDDASTDGTEELVKSYPQVNYIRRNKNFGCDTRPKNQGAKHSKGEYIAYLDDDNAFRPDHLQALINEFERDPKLDVVYGDRIVIDDTGVNSSRLGFTSDYSDTLLMQRNFIDTSDVLMKRSALFDVGGWDERYKKYVDWNLWVRMAKFGKQFKRVPVVITEYHLHDDMKSMKVKDVNPVEGQFVPEWDSRDVEVELPYLKDLKLPNVAIFMITYDRLNYTKLAIESLYKMASYPFDLFIVDNGSTDGTIEYLEGLRKEGKIKEMILNSENCGISKASNQAVDVIMKGDYQIVGKYDNDCISMTSGWLSKIVDIWKINHRLALSPYVSGLKDNPGGAPRVAYGHIGNELIGVTKHLGGICVFTSADAYKSFRWDEDSFLHGVQDMEFSQYLLFNDYRLGYLENYQVSHGPQGTTEQIKDFPEYFDRRKTEKTKRYDSNGK